MARWKGPTKVKLTRSDQHWRHASATPPTALGLLKQDKSKGSVKKKRKRAGWDYDALLTIVQNAV